VDDHGHGHEWKLELRCRPWRLPESEITWRLTILISQIIIFEDE
jgi:hypothetical protein